MNNKSKAVLISYNMENLEICASAARISTTKGNAIEIFEKSKSNEKNQELVKKVLQSGHKSIIEHVILTFALNNVSAFVEQFFIECRLASFTVKSRRYVDFSEFGYYIPSDLEGEDLKQYCQYMDNLFSAYKIMLDNGIPKEDARFLLPYSFCSNFYCTINARELLHVIYDMKYGRGYGIPELQDLAEQLIEQVNEILPYLRSEMKTKTVLNENRFQKNIQSTVKIKDYVSYIKAEEMGTVRLLNEPSDPVGILKIAYGLNHSVADDPLNLKTLVKFGRPRELEQLSYSFCISNITLSGITHFVRHRMQSIIVPSIQGIEHSKFVVPDTIKKDFRVLDIYKNILECSNHLLNEICKVEKLRKYSYYYALSGNVMDVITTINARELLHFIKLRACNRAQWEIRNISIEMLIHLRRSFPELYNHFGPSCFVDGMCPEKRMSCEKMEEVIIKFKTLR